MKPLGRNAIIASAIYTTLLFMGQCRSLLAQEKSVDPRTDAKPSGRIESEIKGRRVDSTNAAVKPTHGTVNVFLANKNGLVVVTDSRLSNGRVAVGYGQKLFKIDDRTICAIAGWYSDPSLEVHPNIDTKPTYPAYLDVPQMMRTIIGLVHNAPESIEWKTNFLAESFEFSLLAIANIDEIAGRIPSFSKSEITVAGFDPQGSLKILQVDLLPQVQNGKLVGYDIQRYPDVNVSDSNGFSAIFRGIDNTARAIIGGTEPFIASDPILDYFGRSLKQDRGRSLTLSDMKQIAKEIARRTALHYPVEVGGDLQIAQISEDKVTVLNQPNTDESQVPPMLLNKMDGIVFPGGFIAIANRFPTVFLAINSKFSNLRNQPLDNIFFVRSTFTHCNFTYGGSPRSIFDKSNTVVDSTLTLPQGLDLDSNFLNQIKIDFPQLKIINQSATPSE